MSVYEGKPGEQWRCENTQNGSFAIWQICDKDELAELRASGRVGDNDSYVYVVQSGVNTKVTSYRSKFASLQRLSRLSSDSRYTWTRVKAVEPARILDPVSGEPNVAFGLHSQGKFQLVEQMFKEGKSWQEIGAEIGWTPDTAERFYELERSKP